MPAGLVYLLNVVTLFYPILACLYTLSAQKWLSLTRPFFVGARISPNEGQHQRQSELLDMVPEEDEIQLPNGAVNLPAAPLEQQAASVNRVAPLQSIHDVQYPLQPTIPGQQPVR